MNGSRNHHRDWRGVSQASDNRSTRDFTLNTDSQHIDWATKSKGRGAKDACRRLPVLFQFEPTPHLLLTTQ